MAATITNEMTMLALYQDRYGDLDTYKIGLVPVPSPGQCQVRVRVHAVSLNPLDIKRGIGQLYGARDQFPLIPGYDFAGVVELLGEGDCCGLQLRDYVYGNIMRCQGGRKENFMGTACEYCVVDCDLLGKMPTRNEQGGKVGFEEMTALPTVGMMAIECFQNVDLKKDDQLLITEGNNEFSLHAIQIAKALYDVQNVATTVTKGNTEFVKEYGADRIINCDEEDPAEVLKGWASVVIDVTDEIEMEKRILRPGGRHLSIVGGGKENVRSFTLCPTREKLDVLSSLVVQNKIRPVISKVYPLREGIRAIKDVKEGSTRGKVVVRVVE